MRQLKKTVQLLAIAAGENNQYTTMSTNLYRDHYSNDILESRFEFLLKGKSRIF